MNEVNPYNPRLRNYELELERHLRNVLLKIEEQLRKQELGQRTIRVRHQRLQNDEPTLKREVKRLKRELNENDQNFKRYLENEGHDKRALEQAASRLDEFREELLGEIQSEKDLRQTLDDLNHHIHSVQQQYDSVAWPEKNDVKLMKGMVSKAYSNVATMEKDKRIQDAYIDRLRKDIEISETELEQLAVTAKRLKEHQATERGEFVKLKDQLEMFESGKMQLEDHYAKLMKSLQNNRNKVRLLDRRHVSFQLSYRELIKQSTSLQQHQSSQSTAKGAAFSKRIMRLSDARIMRREAANHHLRQVSHRQQMSAPDIDRELQEAERTRQKLRIRAQAAEDEHESVRRERQSDLRPSDVQTVSESYEHMEKQLFLHEFKLKAYKKVIEELDELVKERKASDKLAPAKLIPDTADSNGLRRSRSANENDWKIGKSYQKMRDSITELVRKKVALEYKRKRLEEKIDEKHRDFQTVQQKVNAVQRSQDDLEKQHEEKMETAMPIVDITQIDEKDPEGVLEQKIVDYTSRLRFIEIDTMNMHSKLEEVKSECVFFRSKIGDFETLESMSEKHAYSLNEIHQLQKQHQQLEKELWQVQKELEYTVMRRDYAVNRARTVLGTHNEIRVQRQQNNDKLREEIFELEQTVQSTMSFLSI
ncbi:hypothetical protein M3Y97_00937400 [Aphelenchoides bicaudatus]|nr:hypothetical protein M3Y97_00937400 [Aphelenchoides bicaudatus]